MRSSGVLVLMALLVVLGAIFAFGTLSLEPPAGTGTSAATQPSNSQKPLEALSVTGATKERVAAGGVALTVDSVEWKTDQAEASLSDKPILLVHVTIQNTDDSDPLDIGPGEFDLRQPNGDIVNSAAREVVEGQIAEVAVAPGSVYSATVPFQLEERSQGLHLLYDFNDQHIDIDLDQ